MLLLLHGALGDHRQFDELRSLITSTRVGTVDFEGHGSRASAGRPLRMEYFLENAIEQMDAEGIDSASMFGYSMGGYVALLMAARYPDRVSRVMTLGTRLVWSPEIAAKESRQLDSGLIREKVPRFAAQLEARHTATGWEKLLHDTSSMMHALGAAPLLTETGYGNINCPVRLCVGDRDTTAGVEDTRAVQQLIPNAQLEVLPGTPHPFEKVNLARLAYSLTEFMT